uniref:condensation domain-containing protein n=1 Tax=Streptomyces sp. CA-141956 TaxID=3240051 RepID=UPI003F492003
MRTDLKTLVGLEKGPLFAHALVILGPNRHLWYHRAHHIDLDGYGFSLIANRTAQHYTALTTGLPPLHRHPAPCARWWTTTSATSSQPSAKQTVHSGTPATPTVPKPSVSAGTSPSPGRLLRSSTQLPARTLDSWRAVADRSGPGWAEVAITLIARHLHEHTGADEVILGLPVMGRWGPAARTPAMVMNIVPLRIPIRHGAPLQDTVRVAAAELRAIRPHQRYRGEQLRRDLKLVGGSLRLSGRWSTMWEWSSTAEWM